MRYYNNVAADENWFLCIECKRVWRLVEPDFPFEGDWGLISDKEYEKFKEKYPDLLK